MMTFLTVLAIAAVLITALVLRSQAKHRARARTMDDNDLEQECFWSIQKGDFPNAYTIERNRRYLAENVRPL